jgi:hypothetical protein
MTPFSVSRTRDNLLREGEAFGAEMRSAARLLASLLLQEFDLDPEETHSFRLEFEIDANSGAPCSLALFVLEDDAAEGDEEEEPDEEDEA